MGIFFCCNRPSDSKVRDSINNINDYYDEGFFIVNEGNFDWGVGTLSHYSKEKNTVSNKIFSLKNGFELGNVFQSASIYDSNIWMVINNSEQIIIADYKTIEHKKTLQIKGSSPRYLQKISDKKYYLTELYGYCYWILKIENNNTWNIQIERKEISYQGTERMILYNGYIFMTVNRFTVHREGNYSAIIKIDPVSDEIVDTLKVPLYPNSMTLDKNNKIWILSGNHYTESSFNILRIDPENMKKEFDTVIPREKGIMTWPSHLVINEKKDVLYFQNMHIWRFDIDKEALEDKPFIEIKNNHQVYGLNISNNDEIYVSDAIDYNQDGYIRIYDNRGQHEKDIKVGIIPNGVVFID